MADDMSNFEIGNQQPDPVKSKPQGSSSNPLASVTEGGSSILFAGFGGQAEIPPMPAPPVRGTETRKPRKNPLGSVKGRVIAGLATLGIVAGGATAAYIGSNRGGEDEDNPSIMVPLETATPSQVPTIEATPTKEPEKYLFEIGFELAVNENITLGVTKDMMGRTTTNGVLPYGGRIESLRYNTEKYGDTAQEQFASGVNHELYLAWLSRDPEGRESVSESDYIEKIKNGDEDVKIEVPKRGVKGESILSASEPIFIDPRNLKIVFTNSQISGVTNGGGSSVSFREMEDASYIEIYDDWAGGVGDPTGIQYGASQAVAIAFTALKSLKAIEMGRLSNETVSDLRKTQASFMPFYDQNSKANTFGLMVAGGSEISPKQ